MTDLKDKFPTSTVTGVTFDVYQRRTRGLSCLLIEFSVRLPMDHSGLSFLMTKGNKNYNSD